MKREETLSPREAAQRLNVGMQRIYDLLHSGKLQGLKEGNRWTIPETAIAVRERQLAEFRRLCGLSKREARNG